MQTCEPCGGSGHFFYASPTRWAICIQCRGFRTVPPPTNLDIAITRAMMKGLHRATRHINHRS